MKEKMGIWIDHKTAFLVSLNDGETHIEQIDSNADSNVRARGGYKSGGTAIAQSVSKERSAEERRKFQLTEYYQTVIKAASNADEIYVCGPGQARSELEKEFRKFRGLQDRIKAVEACDSMTENQIVAKVRSFFSMSKERFSI
ncbi:MAG: hypothetical protein OEQ28_15580 [Acidobacteriota bacterium]|nr:hypothetical protein [Acidobacteriota bacterium]